jgi:hypothetical protein
VRLYWDFSDAGREWLSLTRRAHGRVLRAAGGSGARAARRRLQPTQPQESAHARRLYVVAFGIDQELRVVVRGVVVAQARRTVVLRAGFDRTGNQLVLLVQHAAAEAAAAHVGQRVPPAHLA